MPQIAKRSAGTSRGYPPVELAFPVGGIDQSQPRSKQNPLTCTDALNVVGFPPLSDRDGGGKREGSRRAFSDQMTNAGASTRVLGLNAVAGAVANATQAATDALFTIHSFSDKAGYPFPTGSWLPVGGPTTVYQCIDEDPFNTTDYVEAHPAVSGSFGVSEFRVGLESGGGGPASGTLPTVTILYRITGISGGSGDSFDSGGAGDAGAVVPLVPNALSLIVSVYYNVGGGDIFVRDYEASSSSGGDWLMESFQLTQDEVDLIDAAGAWTGNNKIVLAVTAEAAGLSAAAFFDVSTLNMILQDAGGPPPPNYVTPGKVLALQDSQCYVGDLTADSLAGPAVTTLANAYPQIDFWNGLWYCVDGEHSQYIDATPTVTTWTASTAGTIPPGCKLITFYRDRAVLANQASVSSGDTYWFMSAIGDPYDWAYGADDIRPAEDSAVAGTNHFLGKPSDSITALIPWNDDRLIFGGASSIWKLEGDPGYGGVLMNHSQETGVLGPRAWCFDEHNNLWFMGASGLYMNAPDGQPVSVSGRKLYRFLDRLDGKAVQVQLAYNAFKKHIDIFLTPVAAFTSALHIRYDIEAKAFWFLQYASAAMGPYSVCQLSGPADDDRQYLIGGNDGYARRPFDGGKLDADGNIGPTGTVRWGTADDMLRVGTGGIAIESSVRFAPIEYPLGDLEMTAMELIAYGTDNNLPLALPFGPVQWLWLTGDSCGSVASGSLTDAVRNGQWFGPGNVGQQLPVGLRESAGAHQLVVRQHSSSQSWALDRIVCKFQPGARRR